MLNVVFYVLVVSTVMYGTYFVMVGFGLIKRKNNMQIENKRNKNKFGIVIASRNEEKVIGNLVESLKKQDYPNELYEIFVVVNNCTDETEDIAREKGATAIKCDRKVSSKGEVLKFIFNKLSERTDIDAYVIFDADNIVHRNFIKEMNKAINDGYNVAQGFRDTKNISDNWLSSSYAILYYIQSLFVNKPRYNLGKSSFINGTGFMVKKSVIDKYGFNPKTLTEDIEFTAMCAINNEKIAFAEKAITYDEQVIKFRDSLKQRKRWSFGTKQCLASYFKTLLKSGVKERRFECFDVILFYLLTFVQIIFTFIPILMLFKFNSFTSFNSIMFNIGTFMLSYLCGIIFRIFIVKYYGKKIKDNLGGILFFDLFLLSWLPLNIFCLFEKRCDWTPIKHNRNVNIKNI